MDSKLLAAAISLALFLVPVGAFAEGRAPEVDASSTARSLEATPRPKARPFVTVYEVRTSVSEIDPRAAGEMFTTALIKSRQFRVMERQRLEQGVARERNLNAQSITSGAAAATTLSGAAYVFEATFSEANAGKSKSEGGVSLGGMSAGGGRNTDEIGMDVRVVNVATGEVVDAVNVRKAIDSETTSISGVGSLIDSVAALRGKSTRGLTPDMNYQSSRKDGVDRALRSVIELAVLELARRSREWVEEDAAVR